MTDYIKKVIMKYSGLGAAEDIEAYRAMEDYHDLQSLADKRLELLELLKRLEWVEYEPYSMVVYPEPKVWKECLICEHWFEHGHAPDCELAEAIDEV